MTRKARRIAAFLLSPIFCLEPELKTFLLLLHPLPHLPLTQNPPRPAPLPWPRTPPPAPPPPGPDPPLALPSSPSERPLEPIT